MTNSIHFTNFKPGTVVVLKIKFKYPRELVVGDLIYQDWPMAYRISMVLKISQNKTHQDNTDILVLTCQNTIQILNIPNYKTIRCHVKI